MNTYQTNQKWHIAVLCLLFPVAVSAQEINIGTGAQVIAEGNISLVLTDAGLTNNGSLNAQGGSFIFKGSVSSDKSFIGGTSTSQFNNLSINKTANHVTLNSSIAVKGNLNFVSNNLLLNNNEVNLGSTGQLSGESSTSYTSGPGFVSAQSVLNAPASANPGNLGIAISSASNLGPTTVKRYNSTILLDANNSSLKRSYDIIPTNNTNLNASVVFNYLDPEITGLTENDLILWTSNTNGISWNAIGSSVLNAASNQIQTTALSSLGKITAGTNYNVLSVTWKSFTAEPEADRILLKWATLNESNNKRFEVLRSTDGVHFDLLTIVKPAENSHTGNSYLAYDLNPLPGTAYYQIKQIDNDGTTSASVVRTVKSLSDYAVKIYPIPVKDLMNIRLNSLLAEQTTIKLYNLAGLAVAAKEVYLHAGINHLEWDLTSIPAGIYILQNGLISQKPVKIIKE